MLSRGRDIVLYLCNKSTYVGGWAAPHAHTLPMYRAHGWILPHILALL